MAKRSGLSWKNGSRLADLQHELGLNLDVFETLARKSLDKKVYSREDVLDELEIADDELVQHFLSVNTKHLSSFKLRQRTLHVIQGLRFNSIC